MSFILADLLIWPPCRFPARWISCFGPSQPTVQPWRVRHQNFVTCTRTLSALLHLCVHVARYWVSMLSAIGVVCRGGRGDKKCWFYIVISYPLSFISLYLERLGRSLVYLPRLLVWSNCLGQIFKDFIHCTSHRIPYNRYWDWIYSLWICFNPVSVIWDQDLSRFWGPNQYLRPALRRYCPAISSSTNLIFSYFCSRSLFQYPDMTFNKNSGVINLLCPLSTPSWRLPE